MSCEDDIDAAFDNLLEELPAEEVRVLPCSLLTKTVPLSSSPLVHALDEVLGLRISQFSLVCAV
jgi:hypothetical protein